MEQVANLTNLTLGVQIANLTKTIHIANRRFGLQAHWRGAVEQDANLAENCITHFSG
jgi:hypothetical protein